MHQYKTKNDIPEKTRIQVAGILQKRLAMSIDLALQLKQAHWNVKGPQFAALHELFDQLTSEAQEYADTMAERIAQLGGSAHGTIQAVIENTELAKYPLNIGAGHDHLNAISASMAYYASTVREAIDETDRLGDKGTADLFTGVSRGIDKALWMIEAHLQAER